MIDSDWGLNSELVVITIDAANHRVCNSSDRRGNIGRIRRGSRAFGTHTPHATIGEPLSHLSAANLALSGQHAALGLVWKRVVDVLVPPGQHDVDGAVRQVFRSRTWQCRRRCCCCTCCRRFYYRWRCYRRLL